MPLRGATRDENGWRGWYPEGVWGRQERSHLTGAVSPKRSRPRDALRRHRLLHPARGSTQDSVCMCWASPAILDLREEYAKEGE